MESCQLLFLVCTILYTLPTGGRVEAFAPPPPPPSGVSSSSSTTTGTAFRTRTKQVSRPFLDANHYYWTVLQNSNSNENHDAAEGKDDETTSNSSDGGGGGESDLSWMRDAMGVSSEDLSKEQQQSNNNHKLPLQSGISGFAVDEQLGFVCVLVPEEEDDEDDDDEEGTPESSSDSKTIVSKTNHQRFTYAVVSPTDKDKLSSPEGLCLVQLAGGLDLGAAVFPPETLARVVAAELEDEEDEEHEINVEELRSKVTLLGVTAVKNENYTPREAKRDDGDDTSGGSPDEASSPVQSSPERDAKIEEGSPKMLPAIRNLPGLAEITTEEIVAAMQIHADASGKLDRQGFSELLGTLRGGNAANRVDDQKVKFRITASLVEQNDGDASSSPSKLVGVDNVPPFQAIALAMRYKVTVDVSDGCFDDDADDDSDENVYSRFPAFKPAQELAADAKVMDGFISSMFFKGKPAPGNDDKLQ